MPRTLLLVDGNALFYRAFHAFPKELTTPTGTPSGAAFGFTRILVAAIRTLKPTHLAVCFDMSGGTFRDELYESYKATRSKTPDELAVQIPMIWELVDRLEVPRYTSPGFEADDLIGTLANQAAQDPDFRVIILSGDQDLIQLVTDDIHVYAPAVGFSKATFYTPEKVEEKYGFPPPRMIDYKALRGDPSDNIPGVPGIGEVSAKQLIGQFGTLDSLYEAVHAKKTDGIKPAVLKKLQEHEASARLSYTLATIRTDAPVTFTPDPCRLRLENPEPLISLFQEYGFKSLIQELPQSHRLISQAADVFNGASRPEQEASSLAETPVPTPHQTEADQIDAQLAPVLRSMEERGVTVDKPYLKKLEKEFSDELTSIKQELYKQGGEEFNPDSPSQVGKILYEKLAIPTDGIRKRKSGYTTDAATLQELAPKHPIAATLLRYREVAKLQSTYVRPLQELADSKGRVHTSYAPDTSTGRISSRNPNLQNIPIRSEQGKRIRQAFIAPKKHVLLSADYSQIELRVAAHLSQDPAMLEAFQSGRDFHAETAARMGVDRRIAKIINFSILYGKGAFGFSQDLGISLEEARHYIEQYFTTFAGLRKYLDKVLEEARANEYVETMHGHRRQLPDLTTSNYQRRSAAEREAVNLPIQGTAAEILKKAMVDLDQELQTTKSPAKLILTVHDELVLEVPTEHLESTGVLLRRTMEESTKLSVPIQVEVKHGSNWREVTPLELPTI